MTKSKIAQRIGQRTKNPKPRSLPRMARAAKPKSGLKYVKDLMKLEEAEELVKLLEGERRDKVFGEEREKYAEYLSAVKVVFGKDRSNVSRTLTDALTGWWGGPEHLFESGYMQMSRELNVAIDALGKIEPVGDWQKDRMFDVTCTLRGIQRRLAAMPCVAKMFADAAEECGVS